MSEIKLRSRLEKSACLHIVKTFKVSLRTLVCFSLLALTLKCGMIG